MRALRGSGSLSARSSRNSAPPYFLFYIYLEASEFYTMIREGGTHATAVETTTLPPIKGHVPETFEGIRERFEVMAQNASGSAAKTGPYAEAEPKPAGWFGLGFFKSRRELPSIPVNPHPETALDHLIEVRGLKTPGDLAGLRAGLTVLSQEYWPGYVETVSQLLRAHREDEDVTVVSGSWDYEGAAKRYGGSLALLSEADHDWHRDKELRAVVKAGGFTTSGDWDEFNRSLKAVDPKVRRAYAGGALADLVKSVKHLWGKDVEGLSPVTAQFMVVAESFQRMAEGLPTDELRVKLSKESLRRLNGSFLPYRPEQMAWLADASVRVSGAGFGAYVTDYVGIILPALKDSHARIGSKGDYAFFADRFVEYLDRFEAPTDKPSHFPADALRRWVVAHSAIDDGRPSRLSDPDYWDSMLDKVEAQSRRLLGEGITGELRMLKLADYVGWDLSGKVRGQLAE